jgi:hypothetical protein
MRKQALTGFGVLFWLIGTSFGVAACGGSSEQAATAPPANQYTSEPGKTVTVGAGPTAGTVTSEPQKECGPNMRADVVVDSSGKVVEVLCYPASSNPTPIEDQGNVDLGKENKGVVAIDGANDGVDVGSIDSKGNNVVVYGQGPGVSIIGGDVKADGNNFAMRGVTVKKDVTIKGNNAALVLCVIEGNLTIEGNNATVADCSVLGKITINGSNNTLVANEVGNGIEVSETQNLVCDANVVWNDANTNKVLDPGESGAAVQCTNKK